MKPHPDIESRTRVWMALSELFLDTDVTAAHEQIARELAASPYGIDEIARMLAEDVHPVCKWNLLGPAGVWTGFDQEWLVGEITRERGPLARRWNRLLGRRAVSRCEGWRRVRIRVTELRSRR